jgi:hypothetical protein
MRSKIFPWVWPGLLGLVLGTSVATAGPTAGPATSPGGAKELCPVPDKATCLSKTIQGTYLDSACGKKHKAVCKPFVEEGLEKDRKFATAPKAKMLRAKGSNIPKDLREGKRIAYRAPKPGKLVHKPGTHSLARTKLTSPPPAVPVTVETAKKAHRNPAWDANGQKITSCAEYAYERHYDWSRFTDAAAACKGDENCVIDVAMLPATPGIADRKLKRRDGKNLAHQIIDFSGIALPKNVFYAAAAKFLYSGGPEGVPKTPELEQLKADLEKGWKYYGLCALGGPCKGVVKVGSRWGFHKQLHDANRDLSPAEFQEYKRRRDQLAHLLHAYDNASAPKMKLPAQAAAWVSPLEEMAQPIDQLNQLRIDSEKWSVPQTQKQGALDRDEIDAAPPVSVLGMAPTVKKASKAPLAKKSPAFPKDPCHKSNFEMPKGLPQIAPLACKIGHLIRAEYKRKLDGQKSCLDMDSKDCDWSPDMFLDDFVGGLPYLNAQQADEEECLAWTGDSLGSGGQPNIKAVEDLIKKNKAAVAEALEKLKSYDQGSTPVDPSTPGSPMVRKFGTDLGEAEAYGDKGMFAAGYDYALGWGIQPSALDTDKNDRVCQLGGWARGGFGVDAWLVGSEYEIIDGLASGVINGSLANDHAGPIANIGNKKGHVHAHLRVLGENVLDPPVDVPFSLHHTFSPESWQNSIDLPPGYKPSFTIMAGPVPISGAVWAEFFYGASFQFEADMNGTCDADNINFVGRAIFTPEMGVNGRAQVGIGIAGLLSAGIRGALNLVTIGVPVTNELKFMLMKVGDTLQPALRFSTKIGLSLGTLSGWLSLYIEFLIFEEEFELIRWSGLSTTIDLMPPTEVELPMSGMKL